MRRIIYCFIAAFTAISFSSLGQHENTLYSLGSVPQSVYNNPALAPNYNFSIGLPGISSTYFSFANTGFAYKDIKNKEGNSNWINLNDFYAGLKPKNHTKVMVATDIFSLGFKAGSRMHVTFNVTEKVQSRLMLPKGILWAIPGNAPEVAGNTIKMGPTYNAMHYREFGLGTSYTVNKKLTVGVRGKLLFGKANVHTKKSDLTLTTSSEGYQLTLAGNALVNTAGIDKYLNEDEDSSEEPDVMDYLLNKNNKGFAIDLGASYKLMDRLTISASIVDLGSIKWKDDVKNYEMKDASYTFEGFNINESDDFENISDTIDAKFKFEETSNPYRTGLPTKVYIGGSYLLTKNFYGSLLFFGEIYQKNFSPSISAALTKDFGKILSLSLSYTAANRSASQIGTGVALKLGAAQIYFISDNIVGTALMPQSAKNLNARFGINLIFGRKLTEEKQTYK